MEPARRAPGVLEVGELQLRLALRRLRGRGGVSDAVAQLALALAALPVGAVFAVLIGYASHEAAKAGHGVRATAPVTAVIYGIWQTWVAVGLSIGGRDALDLRRLLVYPVRPSRLYLLGLATSLFADPFAIFWLLLLAGMLAGAAVARPGPWLVLEGAVLAAFAAATVAFLSLSHELLVRLVRRRFWREATIVAAVAAWLGIVISVSDGVDTMRVARPAFRVLGWSLYPAALATEATHRLYAGQIGGALRWLALLALSAVATGFAGFRLALATARGGGAPPRARHAPKADHTRRLPRWLGPLLEKELLYLARHPAVRIYALVLPAIAAVIGWKGHLQGRGDLPELVGALPLFALAAYVHLALQAFWVNAFGWDRGGARAMFLAPVAASRILEVKNLALWLHALALFALAGSAYVAFAGPPPAWALACAVALAAGLAPVLYGLGNVVSVLVPRAVPAGAQRAGAVSPTAALAAMAITSGAVALFGLPALVAVWTDALWLMPALWSALAITAIVAWRASLPAAGRLLELHKEALLEVVCGDGA